MAIEVLQEVVLEALDHADRFNPSGQPMAWLLGIAINVIKRKKAELARRSQRELSIGDLSLMQEEHLSESELFDQLTADSSAGPDQEIAANEQAELLLSLVSPEDQQILMLAFLGYFSRCNTREATPRIEATTFGLERTTREISRRRKQ